MGCSLYEVNSPFILCCRYCRRFRCFSRSYLYRWGWWRKRRFSIFICKGLALLFVREIIFFYCFIFQGQYDQFWRPEIITCNGFISFKEMIRCFHIAYDNRRREFYHFYYRGLRRRWWRGWLLRGLRGSANSNTNQDHWQQDYFFHAEDFLVRLRCGSFP